jgi:hypothetical protein
MQASATSDVWGLLASPPCMQKPSWELPCVQSLFYFVPEETKSPELNPLRSPVECLHFWWLTAGPACASAYSKMENRAKFYHSISLAMMRKLKTPTKFTVHWMKAWLGNTEQWLHVHFLRLLKNWFGGLCNWSELKSFEDAKYCQFWSKWE